MTVASELSNRAARDRSRDARFHWVLAVEVGDERSGILAEDVVIGLAEFKGDRRASGVPLEVPARVELVGEPLRVRISVPLLDQLGGIA